MHLGPGTGGVDGAGGGRPVRIGVLLWTERTTWPALRAAAVAADRIGVDSLWVSDHLFAATGPDTDPCFEAWTTLAALAAVTERVTVGPLVGAVGLRNPGVTAKMLTTLDHVSGGRSVLGLGSGWLAREFTAHGIDWEESAADRVRRLDEAIDVIERLLAGGAVTHRGQYYQLDAASQAPCPLRARVPIAIGGEGRRHTLDVVARRADLWNARGGPTALRGHDAALAEHCARVGRDPASIERCTNRWIAIRPSRQEARTVLLDSLRDHGIDEYDDQVSAVGDVSDVATQLRPTLDVGFRHLIFSFREPFDLATIEALGDLRTELDAVPASHPTAPQQENSR